MDTSVLARLLIAYRSWIYRAFGYAASHPRGTWIVATDAVWLGHLARSYQANEQAQRHTQDSVRSAGAAAARASRVGVRGAATDARVARHLRDATAATLLAVAALQDPAPPPRRSRRLGVLVVGAAATGGLVWAARRRQASAVRQLSSSA